jgi:RNA-directed DNA polymerase
MQRWLEAPISKDGVETARTKGTPQGGGISPLLANLFMHYAFDRWITDKFPNNKWCRYADDGLVHCKSYAEAQAIREELKKRFESCGIEIHPAKTKIIYCRDNRRRQEFGEVKFDFLGFTLRPRLVRNQQVGQNVLGFTPGISRTAIKSINQTIRTMRHRVDLSLDQLAEWINPKMRGWINYYGKFNRSSLHKIIRQLHKTIVA